MTSDELRLIETELGLNHPEMARLLGCSLIGYKRFVTGARPIPEYVAKFSVALKFINDKKLMPAFLRLAAEYCSKEKEGTDQIDH